jgi:hypothetical protein
MPECMKKDIFIDNNIAKNFSNPMDEEYKKLIQWLLTTNGNEDEDKNAYLVVSQKLLVEYISSSQYAASNTSIPVMINTLQREGRLIKFDNQQIKEFQRKYFKSSVLKNLKSNREDRDHIPIVCLSDRKYALTIDDKLFDDLRDFPGFKVWVEKRPENLDYEN